MRARRERALVDAGTKSVSSEKHETGSRLRQTLLVVVACTAVPVVATITLVAVKRALNSGHAHRFTQRQVTTKNLTGHVMQTTGNGSQQLALGYVHHQVDFKRF